MAAIDLGGIFGSENEPDENEADENEGGRPAAQSNQRSGISIPVALLLIVLAALTWWLRGDPGAPPLAEGRRVGPRHVGPPLGVRRAARARDKGQQARHEPGLASRVQRPRIGTGQLRERDHCSRREQARRESRRAGRLVGPPPERPVEAHTGDKGSTRKLARHPDHSELDQREFTTRSAYQAVERGC